MSDDKYYQAFRDTVSALEIIVTGLGKAIDIRELNDLERQAQQALFNLQHTAMGLAYWVQATAQTRRRAINNGEISQEPPKATKEIPVIETHEEPKEEGPKKRTWRRGKNNKKGDE